MDIIRIVCVCAVCSAICLVLKQMKPEIAPFLQLSCVILVFTLFASGIKSLLNAATDMTAGVSFIYDEYVFLLVRVLGIALITKIGTEICKDSGVSVLAVIVELAGKTTILLLCLPLLKMVVRLANGILS